MTYEYITSTKTCPQCGKPMREYGATFLERGAWDGKQYAHEGEFDTFACDKCNVEVTIANKLTEAERWPEEEQEQ